MTSFDEAEVMAKMREIGSGCASYIAGIAETLTPA
jgi:hypothetical protein